MSTGCQKDRKTDRQIEDRKKERMSTGCQKDRKTDRQTSRQTKRQTDRRQKDFTA